MQEILKMAGELGQALAHTDEYQALRRAMAASGDDRELAELQNKLREMEGRLEARLRQGEEPTEKEADEYDAVFSRLQVNPAYQRIVVAQVNFDKIVSRVNETIHQGIEKGSQSRIILP